MQHPAFLMDTLQVNDEGDISQIHLKIEGPLKLLVFQSNFREQKLKFKDN